MSFALHYDVSELNSVADVFNRLAADNQRELLARVGDIVVMQTSDRFENQQDPDGNTWEPSQRAKAKGDQTLKDSGDLLKSVVHEAFAGSVAIGSDEPYAAIHQFGGTAGRGHSVVLPARAYLGINDSDAKEIEQEVLDYYGAFLA